MLNIPKVAQYARFSSDNQRSESIDAQIRAMNQFCKQNHWQVVSTYTDEARSATTDNRPQFQQMIADSGKGLFDIVLVHKLDRFSRDRYDSAIYKKKLKKNHVKLCSVLERMDDSPESIMMEAVLEGMSEYYSKNLAREVMKGMNETALQCKHTGGCPPLGYDLDENRHLVINEQEAQAVKIIFQMFAEGYGYTAIIDHLNAHGTRQNEAKCSERTAFMRFYPMKNILVFLCSIRRRQEQMENEITTPKKTAISALKAAVLQSSGKSCSHRCSGSRRKINETQDAITAKSFTC